MMMLKGIPNKIPELKNVRLKGPMIVNICIQIRLGFQNLGLFCAIISLVVNIWIK